MFKETLTYTDYNGSERTETFHFNLTETEITKMDVGQDGGMEQLLKQIVDKKDGKQLIDIFDRILLGAYGEKTADGRFFKKSEEIAQNFKCSPAYDIIWMKLCTDAEYASTFVNNIIPKPKGSVVPA